MVAIEGEINSGNAERLARCMRSFVSRTRPLVVDMTDGLFHDEAALRPFFGFNTECAAAGAEWALVAGAAIDALVQRVDRDHSLPMFDSLEQALRWCARTALGR
jgi:STAS domain